MEDTLRDFLSSPLLKISLVLILVLMEDTLRVLGQMLMRKVA